MIPINNKYIFKLLKGKDVFEYIKAVVVLYTDPQQSRQSRDVPV